VGDVLNTMLAKDSDKGLVKGMLEQFRRGSILTFQYTDDTPFTIGKCHSFNSTDEYIQIILVGPKTDEYKVIFVGLGQAPTNIWVIRFDFY
jgi:hypothetical protein